MAICEGAEYERVFAESLVCWTLAKISQFKLVYLAIDAAIPVGPLVGIGIELASWLYRFPFQMGLDLLYDKVFYCQLRARVFLAKFSNSRLHVVFICVDQ